MKLRFLIFSLWIVYSVACQADTWDGIEDEAIPFRTPQGAPVKLIRIPNPRAERAMLMMPGLMESPKALYHRAVAQYHRGFEIFIGLTSMRGLEEIALDDYPALLRKVKALSPGRGISTWGHSLGGIIIGIAFSNPKIASEFSEISSATVIGSPPHNDDISLAIKMAASPLRKLLRQFLKAGVKTLEAPPSIFDFFAWLNEHPNPLIRWHSRFYQELAFRIITLGLNKSLLDRRFTSAASVRNLFSPQFPTASIQLLLDLCDAAITGVYRDQHGYDLLVPENITIRFLVVIGTRDYFTSVQTQEYFYRRLRSADKRLIIIPEMRHCDPILADKLPDDYFDPIEKFALGPEHVRHLPRELVLPKLPKLSWLDYWRQRREAFIKAIH